MSAKRTRNTTTLGKVSTIALVMLMLAMAVLPLIPQEASAARRDRDNETELVINSDVTLDPSIVSDFVAETPETGDPDDKPVDTGEEPTPDIPTESAGIQVNKLECDSDYDADYYQLAANCGPGSAPFTVSSAFGDQYFDGSFTAEVATGNSFVAETLVEGWGQPIVFCNIYFANGGESGFGQWTLYDGYYIAADLSNGDYLYCDWFNVHDGGHDGGYKGTVTIYKLLCADDYEGSSYHQDYIDNCDEQDGIKFELNGYADYKETQTVNNGYAQFDKTVPYGPFTITEETPAGYGTYAVFCGEYYDDPSEVQSYDPVMFGDESINWELEEGWNLICYWINKPAEYHGGDMGGTVTIYKLFCAADYQGGNDYQEYIDNCDEQDGIDFRLYDYADFQQTETVNNGYAQFDKSVPYGAFSIAEEAPAGYGTYAIFCGEYQDDPSEVASYDPTTFNANTMNWDLAEGWNLICYWINTPDYTDGGSVIIHKWECSEEAMLSFPAEADAQWFYDNCTEVMNGIDFTLDHSSGESWTRTTGDDGDGTVFFEGLAPGSLSITEDVPAGYGTPYVVCGWGAIYDEDGDGIAVAVDGMIPGQFLPSGTLDVNEFLMNEQMSCDWFNIPTNDHDITIYKWLCPEGFDAYNASLQDLIQYCDQAMSGIDFTLHTGEVLHDVQNTDQDGYARFEGIQAGDYQLTEALPTGFQSPIVFCTFGDVEYDGMDVEYDTINLGFFDYSVTCHWFNIPSDDSSVTIYKYTCPEGYDIYSPQADPKTDCTYATNGVKYSIYGNGFGELQSTTGDSYEGAVYWDGLSDGDYTVAEWVPDGTVASYVTCQWIEDLGPYYFTSMVPYTNGDYAVGNRIDLEIHHGDDVVCQWFNVPYRPEGGELVIVKYWCDGNIYDEAHCELYGGGIDFQVGAADGNGTWDVTTGANGTVGLYLTPGEYWVKEVGREWCKAESDQVSAEGNMVVYDGQTSYLTVYNCGPGKTKEPPAKKFPNTGVAPSNVQVFLVAVNTKN